MDKLSVAMARIWLICVITPRRSCCNLSLTMASVTKDIKPIFSTLSSITWGAPLVGTRLTLTSLVLITPEALQEQAPLTRSNSR